MLRVLGQGRVRLFAIAQPRILESNSPSVSIDFLDIIEKGYDLDSSPLAWLENVARAIYVHVGAGVGMSAFYYKVSLDNRITVGDAIEIEMPEGVGPVMRSTLESMPPEFVEGSFVRCEAVTQSQVDDPFAREMGKQSMEALSAMFGWKDVLMAGGMDPTRHGLYFGAWLPGETALSPERRATWTRVAVHAVTAYRLRRRLAGDPSARGNVDAVLKASGDAAHAEGLAKEADGRAALKRAVKDLERSRGRIRKDDPDEAVFLRKGLVSGRWTLLDQFENDGKRYVVARRNDVAQQGAAPLSTRERQAVAYASLGHTNKLIAYEMGITATTVAVLLHRAARKLGASSRDELLRAYASDVREAT